MKRLMALLLVCGVVAGCAITRPSSVTRQQALDRADRLARAGQYGEAHEVYASMLRPPEESDGSDRALLGLARIALASDNLGREEQQGLRYLDQLLGQYPQSALAAEACTLRVLLQTALARREEIQRLQQDGRRQLQEVDRLRQELRREQQATLRLRQERERLRQIEMELEQRRATPPSVGR